MPAISGDPPGALAISEVARLTGLSTATLRIWQRRYGLGASRSSPGGHRRYSPQDVARLRAVQRFVGQGLPTAEAVRVVLSPSSTGSTCRPRRTRWPTWSRPPPWTSTARRAEAWCAITWRPTRYPGPGTTCSGLCSRRWANGGPICPTGWPSSTCSPTSRRLRSARRPPRARRDHRRCCWPASRSRSTTSRSSPSVRRWPSAASRRPWSAPRPRPTRSPAPSSAAGRRSSCCSRCSRNSPIPGCSARCHRPTASWPRARAGTEDAAGRRPASGRPARRPGDHRRDPRTPETRDQKASRFGPPTA